VNASTVTLQAIRRMTLDTYEVQLKTTEGENTIVFAVDDADGVPVLHGSEPWNDLCLHMNGTRSIVKAILAFHAASATLDPPQQAGA
jgi:hypothetical protein